MRRSARTVPAGHPIPPVERLGLLERLQDRLPSGASYEIDRAGNRKVGLGYGDLPGSPWMMRRGDVEEAAFAALPEDVDVRYAIVPTHTEQDADPERCRVRDRQRRRAVTNLTNRMVTPDGRR